MKTFRKPGILCLLALLMAAPALAAKPQASLDDTEVPALARPMRQGDVITIEDIIYIPAKSSRIGISAITDAEDLIGKTPRRPLAAEKPLRTTDVSTPIVIRKGDLVSITWKKGGIILTTRGRAMDNAGEGEPLRLASTGTSRIIEANAVSAGQATITAE